MPNNVLDSRLGNLEALMAVMHEIDLHQQSESTMHVIWLAGERQQSESASLRLVRKILLLFILIQ